MNPKCEAAWIPRLNFRRLFHYCTNCVFFSIIILRQESKTYYYVFIAPCSSRQRLPASQLHMNSENEKKKETGKTCLIIRICMYICNQNKNFAVLQGYPDISPLMHSRYSSLKFVTFCPLPRKQTYAIFSLHSTGNGKMSGKVLSFLHHFNNVVWLLCIFGRRSKSI